MALITCNFSSELLGKAVTLNAVIPQKPRGAAPEKYRTLFLLHGLSDDQSTWCRYTSIERYARECNIAVIMPDGGRSFYTDAANGFKYWSFISEELPEFAASIFPLSLKREDCFAAGLSMGGYGALKLGLRCPEKFSAVAALSPVVDLERRFNASESASWRPELENIFISPAEAKLRGNDLFTLAENAVSSGKTLPRIISFCGTEDFMIEDNRKFNAFMKEIKFPEFHSYEYPGSHNWGFWDAHIQQALAFFLKNELPQK